MKLHFLGANRQVTGSRYVLEAAGKRVMIDCGMFQERKFEPRNWDACPLDVCQVESMLLTHVHMDHCGLIPKLVKEGFRGPIHTTRPSAAMLEIMLRDAAGIQEEDMAYKKRRHEKSGRKGKFPYEPLYAEVDVDQVLPLVQPCDYGEAIQATPEITARFFDAGHILGSAMIQVDATEGGRTRRIVFSGDIGQWNKPLIRDPSLLQQADFVVMESTYGNRNHEQAGDTETQLAKVINQAAARGGNVVIPTFAVERAQELLYHIGRLVRAERIPKMPVFLDSPMAVDVTEIFRRFHSYGDEAMLNMLNANQPPLRFPGLSLVRTADDSKQINHLKQPAVIMASSGMCNAGRIKHHLRNNIERPQSTILFVGHQAEGTLGRLILDGRPIVRIHGKDYKVRATIDKIYGFSGHADQAGLMRWIGSFKNRPQRVFLTHGEEQVALGLAELIKTTHGYQVEVPHYQQAVELSVITLDRVETVLRTLPRLTIGLVGDLFLDRYLQLVPGSHELSIETGLEAWQIERVRNTPGALGTVLNNLAALGVGLLAPVTVIGDDGHGYDLLKELRRLPVDTTHVLPVAGRLTPTYTKPMRWVEPTGTAAGHWQELNRLDVRTRGPLSDQATAEVCRRVSEVFRTSDGLIVLDQLVDENHGIVNGAVRDALADFARQEPNKLIYIDSRRYLGKFAAGTLKGNRSEVLSAVSTPSVGNALRGVPEADQPAATALAALAEKTRRPAFCTAGEQGILVARPGAEPTLVPGYPVAGPIDIVGAGDAATSGIVSALLSGCDPLEAAAFGNLVASITVQQLGTTGTATPEQVRARWQEVQRR